MVASSGSSTKASKSQTSYGNNSATTFSGNVVSGGGTSSSKSSSGSTSSSKSSSGSGSSAAKSSSSGGSSGKASSSSSSSGKSVTASAGNKSGNNSASSYSGNVTSGGGGVSLYGGAPKGLGNSAATYSGNVVSSGSSKGASSPGGSPASRAGNVVSNGGNAGTKAAYSPVTNGTHFGGASTYAPSQALNGKSAATYSGNVVSSNGLYGGTPQGAGSSAKTGGGFAALANAGAFHSSPASSVTGGPVHGVSGVIPISNGGVTDLAPPSVRDEIAQGFQQKFMIGPAWDAIKGAMSDPQRPMPMAAITDIAGQNWPHLANTMFSGDLNSRKAMQDAQRSGYVSPTFQSMVMPASQAPAFHQSALISPQAPRPGPDYAKIDRQAGAYDEQTGLPISAFDALQHGPLWDPGAQTSGAGQDADGSFRGYNLAAPNDTMNLLMNGPQDMNGMRREIKPDANTDQDMGVYQSFGRNNDPVDVNPKHDPWSQIEPSPWGSIQVPNRDESGNILPGYVPASPYKDIAFQAPLSPSDQKIADAGLKTWLGTPSTQQTTNDYYKGVKTRPDDGGTANSSSSDGWISKLGSWANNTLNPFRDFGYTLGSGPEPSASDKKPAVNIFGGLDKSPITDLAKTLGDASGSLNSINSGLANGKPYGSYQNSSARYGGGGPNLTFNLTFPAAANHAPLPPGGSAEAFGPEPAANHGARPKATSDAWAANGAFANWGSPGEPQQAWGDPASAASFAAPGFGPVAPLSAAQRNDFMGMVNPRQTANPFTGDTVSPAMPAGAKPRQSAAGLGELPAFQALPNGFADTQVPAGNHALAMSPGLLDAATPSPAYAYQHDIADTMRLAEQALARREAYQNDVADTMRLADQALARRDALAFNSVRPEYPAPNNLTPQQIVDLYDIFNPTWNVAPGSFPVDSGPYDDANGRLALHWMPQDGALGTAFPPLASNTANHPPPRRSVDTLTPEDRVADPTAPDVVAGGVPQPSYDGPRGTVISDPAADGVLPPTEIVPVQERFPDAPSYTPPVNPASTPPLVNVVSNGGTNSNLPAYIPVSATASTTPVPAADALGQLSADFFANRGQGQSVQEDVAPGDIPDPYLALIRLASLFGDGAQHDATRSDQGVQLYG